MGLEIFFFLQGGSASLLSPFYRLGKLRHKEEATRQPEATQQKNHETDDHILGNMAFTAGDTDL